jgi:hypothetical protein
MTSLSGTVIAPLGNDVITGLASAADLDSVDFLNFVGIDGCGRAAWCRQRCEGAPSRCRRR